MSTCERPQAGRATLPPLGLTHLPLKLLSSLSGPVWARTRRTVPRVRNVLWTALIVLFPSFVLAQQPFYTDDADVTPAGKIHVEAFDEHDWLQHGQAPHVRQ